MSKNHRIAAAKVTAELSIHLEDTVSTTTVRQDLHRSYIHGTPAIAKPVVTENNTERRKRWYDDHDRWTSDDWKHIIRSGESSCTLFPTSGRVYVCRTPKEAYNPECLVPNVKHRGGSVMMWAAIYWYSAGLIITLNGRTTSNDYVDILGNQVHPTMRMLLNNDAVFQDEIPPPHTVRIVQSWFEEHGFALQHLSWPVH